MVMLNVDEPATVSSLSAGVTETWNISSLSLMLSPTMVTDWHRSTPTEVEEGIVNIWLSSATKSFDPKFVAKEREDMKVYAFQVVQCYGEIPPHQLSLPQ